jgi:hypothetical protein
VNEIRLTIIMPDMSAALSAKGLEVLSLHTGQAYSKLVVDGPGDSRAQSLLQSLQPADLLAGKVKRADEASCLLSALWLWHDWLDISHTISQKIDTASGSFWHAIMHRREGDFSNSKYWYAKCRSHPAHEALRIAKPGWDAFSFVDLVEEVHSDPRHPKLAEVIETQRLEWKTLFDSCLALA